MDATFTAKLVGTFGLVLDVTGAYCLYYYAFKLPPRLKEQEPLPSSTKQEVIAGVKTTTITAGVSIDLRAVSLNRFHEYRDFLYRKRIFFGFLTLIAGFFLQALGNFIGYSMSAEIGMVAALVSMAAVVIAGGYLFCYLDDVPELKDGTGQKFSFFKANGGFTIESDELFKSWSKKLSNERKKAHLP